MVAALKRLGIIGDVHAEHLRLSRALDLLLSAGAERLVCTGDIPDGHGSVDRCCELLREHRVLTVRGNHDRWLLENRFRDFDDSTQLAELVPASIDFLKELPTTAELETALGRALLCHGLGDNDMRGVVPHDEGNALQSNDELQGLIASAHIDLVLNGHTHCSMVRAYGSGAQRLTVINAGTLRRGQRPGAVIVDFEAREVLWLDVDEHGGGVRGATPLPG